MKTLLVLETIVTEPLVRLTSSGDLHIDKAGWIRRLIDFEGLHDDLLKLKLDSRYDDWYIVVLEIAKISSNDQLVNFIPKLVVQDENINGEIILELFEYDLGRFSNAYRVFNEKMHPQKSRESRENPPSFCIDHVALSQYSLDLIG